jgi:hypothetical protein
MEKENLKLTNKISSLITDDLKKNRKHESYVREVYICHKFLVKVKNSLLQKL